MQDERCPIVVWGGGSGGVAAALQAARAGSATLLLTPGGWLGGMVSAAGVCCPDGNELSPWQSGLWGALLRELARREPGGLDHNWVSCFGYRPATAEAILRHWVASTEGLTWWPCCRLRQVDRQGDRISRLLVERSGPGGPDGASAPADTVALHPELVIDGSDRGELLALASAGFRLGWEEQELWQEPSAPSRQRLSSEPFFQAQPVQSPTWVAMGRLRAQQGCPAGKNSLPPPFAGATSRFGLERTLTYGRLPGDLVMLNWPLQGNDWHGQGDWPSQLERAFSLEAASDPCAQGELEQAMQANSLAFAAALEEASEGWLQLAEVFPQHPGSADLAGPSPLALMPYWREGRRLKGLTTVVEQQLLPQAEGASIAPLPWRQGRMESIAVGNYANDHHYPGPDWPLAPKSCRWGGRWSGTPFCMPYGALVSADTVNLLAADKASSVSHMANGATRLQPLVLNVGQAAGLAAALCLRLGCRPAELPVLQLQQALVQDPLAPSGPLPLWDTPWHHPHWRQRQLAALADPALVGVDGALERGGRAELGADLDPHQAPTEPHEQTWSGLLTPTGDGAFVLEQGSSRWPVITLEPALHAWLQQMSGPRQLSLVGCANPWGPWLRVSRLAH